jgi:hypothetical protein
MADAPSDRGGDIRRQVIFRKGDPAGQAELARRALEAQSRLAAITGSHLGENGAGSYSETGEFTPTMHAGSEQGLHAESLNEMMYSGWLEDRAFTREDNAEIKKANDADDSGKSDDPRRAALRKRAMGVAERRLKKARSGDTDNSKDADSRRAILQDQANMDVTDEDVKGLLSDLGK